MLYLSVNKNYCIVPKFRLSNEPKAATAGIVAGLANLAPKPLPLHGYAFILGDEYPATTAIASPNGENATES
jgi:hypothetical protein